MEQFRKSPHIFWGSLFVLISYFSVALMGTLVKLVPSTVSIGTIIFFQYLIVLLGCLPLVFVKGSASLKTSRFSGHFFRAIVGIITFGLFFLSLSSISMTNAVVLRSTTPFWIPIILLLWRRQSVPWRLWITIVIGFLGVILVVNPSGTGYFSIGTWYALGSGVFVALAALAIRRLSSSEPPHRTLFYYALIATLVTFPFASFQWRLFESFSWLLLMGIGVLMFIIQWTLIKAFQYAKASRLAPMSYTAIVFSALFDWLIWNKIPGALNVVGILVIVGSGTIALLLEKKHE